MIQLDSSTSPAPSGGTGDMSVFCQKAQGHPRPTSLAIGERHVEGIWERMATTPTPMVPTADRSHTSSRIAALDWARGWMLVASVGVNSAIISIPLLAHAPWASVMPIDVIFPLFVTLAGCGMAFAFRRHVQPAGVLRRAFVLVVLGLGYNALVDFTFTFGELRFTGVLQLYAVVIVVIALLHLVTRSWQGWAVLTALLALGHTLMLSIYARACPATLLTPECNPSGPLDAAVFGVGHIYQSGAAGHDPEGLIAISGALVSAAAGAAMGHLILSARHRQAASTRRLPVVTVPLAGLIVGFVALAVLVTFGADLIAGGPVPAMKRLWTAPFALGIAALGGTLLWLGQLALPGGQRGDARAVRAWTPIIALGRNSLLVYFGSHLLMSLLRRPIGDGPSVTDVFASLFPSGMTAQLAWTLAWVGLWVAVSLVLHRRGWYVKP